MPRRKQPVYQEAPELERRLFELQSQIDRLNTTLHLSRERQDPLQPLETRLFELTRQCAEIVDRWTETGERHAQAVQKLEERLHTWDETEASVQQEAAARLQQLERLIEREWAALKHVHEEPARQLQAQADRLSDVSIAAAQTAVSGLDRADARLASFETSFNERLADLSDVLARPDPRLPVAEKQDGKDVMTVREVVKVNHHRNCLLCHAPGNTENTPTAAFKVAVPLLPASTVTVFEPVKAGSVR